MSTETKELLTLAANAMGFAVKGVTVDGDDLETGLFVKKPGIKQKCKWNPLTSADDLVEMECQMEVNCVWFGGCCEAEALLKSGDLVGYSEAYADHNNSRRAARAMASLRVVAEIGKMMEEEE